MNASNQPQREKEIFEQAVEMSSAEAQLAFVKGACGRDAGLLARVETLLRAHEQGQNLLGDAPGRNLGTVLASSPNEESLGASIGRYKLLQKIGEGGCGVVYMAEQEKPVRRRVAL